jgi:hypothetical protein
VLSNPVQWTFTTGGRGFWLGASMVSGVTDGFDLNAELGEGVRDAPGAWRFIRLFAARYATPVIGGDGFGEPELSAAEGRLGFALPGSLREAYALIGKRNDLTRSQDRLLTPDQVRIDDTGQVLVFRCECQHVAEWGIPLSAVAEADPPVVFRLTSPIPARPQWRPFLDRRFPLAQVALGLLSSSGACVLSRPCAGRGRVAGRFPRRGG